MAIVFVHGRAQESYEPEALKATWVACLLAGASAAGIECPKNIAEICDLPYYAKILTGTIASPQFVDVSAENSTRASNDREMSTDRVRLLAEIAADYVEHFSTDLRQPETQTRRSDEDSTRSLSNNRLSRWIARLADYNVPQVAMNTIALTMEDVSRYLTDDKIRFEVDKEIARSISEAVEPRIIVAHSLGSVAAYHVLSNVIPDVQVERLITVGSPLGISAIIRKLESLIKIPLGRPMGLREWINAADRRDIVALNPAIDRYSLFRTAAEPGNRIDPKRLFVTNLQDITNSTDNHHGIAHYLDDPLIASAILREFLK